MSANVDVLHGPELTKPPTQQAGEPLVELAPENGEWTPEGFAREQIRGLVRQLFLAGGERPVRQVVFSAVEPRTDVAGLCDQVAQVLSRETCGDVALVERNPKVAVVQDHFRQFVESGSIKSRSYQVGINLWRVPAFGLREPGDELGTGRYWMSGLAALRNEFEYAIIQGPSAGRSSDAALLGQLADGIILVLGAHSTRKATARKIKETVEVKSRILGTVLSGRTFPVPEPIYRRL